ncbi:MAG: rod shape-determining protein RodA [Saprospiraceae bacterium]
MSKISGINKSVDWVFISVYFSLLIIGWLMLYSSVYVENDPYAFLKFSTSIGKQTLWVLIAIFTFIIVYYVDWKFWETFAFPIFGVSLVLLVLVLVVGSEIKGARSWFSFGGFSFQPSEIAKFGTALALSSYLNSYKSDLRQKKSLFISLGIIIVPILLILLQSDPGSALVFLSFFILFYRLGLSLAFYLIGFLITSIFIISLMYDPKIVTLLSGIIGLGLLMKYKNQSWKTALGFLIISLLAILFYRRDLYLYSALLIVGSMTTYIVLLTKDRIMKPVVIIIPFVVLSALLSFGSNYVMNDLLEPHQQDRINVWLNPEKSDPRGARYNIIQSKLAIGSGGIQGKGFLQGDMTKLNYVPEQTTDFIFSTVGEEQGFIGSVGVIFLFFLLLVRIIIIGERAKSGFIRNYAFAVAGIIFAHMFINIGMAVGLMPIIGIPLPFLSKGGSALIGFSVLLAVLLKMDVSRHRGT